MKNYDPNKPAANNGRYMGLPFTEKDTKCILLPVPWDATTSYVAGTASASQNILQASYQLDLCDKNHPEAWKKGIFMAAPDPEIMSWNTDLRVKAKEIIEAWESGVDVAASDDWNDRLNEFNLATNKFNDKVYKLSKKYLKKRKKVLLIGGDHSTPYGYIKALEEYHEGFGVLQIDAHCDLRKEYEGFWYSHASIMCNVMTDFPKVTNLVQVGVRDWCPEEEQRIKDTNGWIKTHFMHEMAQRMFEGETWSDQCDRIVEDLPDLVYISLDIDGLDPVNCPNTGTPVPGGLQYQQVIYLLEQINQSGRRIIGADLCEVAGLPHEWDGNVGARLAYKLALLLLD